MRTSRVDLDASVPFPALDTVAFGADEDNMAPKVDSTSGKPSADKPPALAKATFGSGCFWCGEALFERLNGVESVVSGYAGGSERDASYRVVANGSTKHAEVFQVTYDPAIVSYAEMLEVFWRTHDPTTLDRQGADVGPQYRSIIFYHDDQQRELAEAYKKKLDTADVFPAPIVTEIEPLTKFFPAEKYHQDYFRQNPNQGYCRVVIQPKLEKFQKVFADKLKPAP